LNTYKETREKLKHFRRVTGLSQQELAEANLERCVNRQPYTISSLAKVLIVNTMDFLPYQTLSAVSDEVSPDELNVVVEEANFYILKLINLSTISIILFRFLTC
jgi:hypothetical protein